MNAVKKGLNLSPVEYAIPAYRQDRTFDDAVTDVCRVINENRNQIRYWNDPRPEAQPSAMTKRLIERHLVEALGVSEWVEMNVTKEWSGVRVTASDGNKLLAEITYNPDGAKAGAYIARYFDYE